jgi:hypothetical protein
MAEVLNQQIYKHSYFLNFEVTLITDISQVIGTKQEFCIENSLCVCVCVKELSVPVLHTYQDCTVFCHLLVDKQQYSPCNFVAKLTVL